MGNGLPSIGNSTLGDKFEKTVALEYGGNGCYYVDVGWAGTGPLIIQNICLRKDRSGLKHTFRLPCF